MRKLILSTVAVAVLVVGGATSASARTNAPDISRTTGSSRAAVKCVQVAINSHFGHIIAEDGLFGPATEDAVYRVQNESGGLVRSDGIVGNNTGQLLWNTLNNQGHDLGCYTYLPTLR